MVTPTAAEGPVSSPLFIGHSHVRSLRNGAALAGATLDVIDLWDETRGLPVTKFADGGQSFSDAVAGRIASHQGPVVALIGGNAHVVVGTLRHPRPFDFVLPSMPDLPLDPEAEVVPSLAVRRLLEKLVKPWITLLTELAYLCEGPVYQLEAPPPSEGSKRMIPTVPWWLFPGMVHQVSPPAFRFKLWKMNSEIIESVCRPLGIEFVPAPAEGKSPRGYLRGRYFEDGFHGNVDYGRLLYEHLLGLV